MTPETDHFPTIPFTYRDECPGCAWPHALGTGPACAAHRAAYRQDRRECASVWVQADIDREQREAAIRSAGHRRRDR